MDEIYLQKNERVYTDNGLLGELIKTCIPTVESEVLTTVILTSIDGSIFSSDVCPFNEVFSEDDRKPANCIPHPLQMLKCVRKSGLKVKINFSITF